MQREIEKAISTNRWLYGWPTDIRGHLASAGRIKRYQGNAVIHPSGTLMRELWIVMEGSLEQRMDARTGARSILSFTQAGDVLGWNVVFSDFVPTYSVVTSGFTRLIHIPGALLRDLLDQRPELWRALARALFDILKRRTDYIAVRTTASLKERIALQLLQMSGKLPNNHDIMSIRITQEDLAFLVGTSRQSINKELYNMKQENLLNYSRERITLLDIPKLISIQDRFYGEPGRSFSRYTP